ncbi:MAG TPA: sigma-70 family RNA polymerase sigma factor [Verrucomicrobiota bacterium]|nr:sigma-70 family RNA polymerase sigma factor [Verrucomicrobiota bacterium]HNU52423.1 sigma-70 family RNA polymerase sigma factor [Verrucomicrobiota bacterium]
MTNLPPADDFGNPERGLVARCRKGDAAAWDELCQRHYPAVGRFVHQLSPDFTREDVEEICQEVFIAVVRRFDTFRGTSALQTWLFRIAVNKARDFLDRRAAAKRGGGRMQVALKGPGEGPGLDPASPCPGPDAVLMRVERARLVRQALDELGDPCRELVELRYFGDLSYEQLAESLRLNPKTVSSRLSKCLDRLEGIARRVLAREENPRVPV